MATELLAAPPTAAPASEVTEPERILVIHERNGCKWASLIVKGVQQDFLIWSPNPKLETTKRLEVFGTVENARAW